MWSGMERSVVWFGSSVVPVSVKGCSLLVSLRWELWISGGVGKRELHRCQCRCRGWRRGGLGLWILLCHSSLVDMGQGVGIGEGYLSIMYREKNIRLRYSITSDGRLA